jgi:hypothetical protein
MVLIAMAVVAGSALAADQPTGQGAPEGMPPMGPPEEMKQIANLVGVWDYVMMMKMDMASEKMEKTTGNVTYAYILDGAAMSSQYDGDEMMGMKFKGFGIQTYDRETKQWQMTWTDNLAARTSIYTGQQAGDSTVLQGEDKMGGQTWWSRMIAFNQKAESYEWRMESSMDGGKTFMVVATATFTKRK